MDSLRKEIDLEEWTTVLSQEYFGCTQREAGVDQHAVQTKTHLFRRITGTEVTNEKQSQKKYPRGGGRKLSLNCVFGGRNNY